MRRRRPALVGSGLRLADAIVAHVWLHEAPERAGLHVCCVDHETGFVGQILQRCFSEQMLFVGGGDTIADPAGKSDTQDYGFRIDGLACKGAGGR